MIKLNFVSAALGFLLLIAAGACKKQDSLTHEQKIEIALDEFVADLENHLPDTNNISDRVRIYMYLRDDFFFGATVTLLDSAKLAVYSPYWYRSNGSLLEKNLADTAYHINDQSWLREPIDSGYAIWTDPYFDAGGGNIWMKTRSVPVYKNGQIIAVATTDLAL
jgi:hypothetical protein